MLKTLIAAVLLAAAGLPFAGGAASAACDVDRPIVLGGLDYDSAGFDNALAKLILTKGYGCTVDVLPGTVLPLVNGLAKGDVHVLMEIWTANPAEAWVKAAREGKVVALGTNFSDTREGWFVPRYLVEGAAAKAPDLKSVQDLARHKDLFADPEEPGKGRFYNCPAGWQCEVINSKKRKAYGLEGAYTNFRPGTGEALAAAIEGAVRRQRPILFYYWGPTWLLGKYDFVMLAEPAFDRATWDAMKASDAPTAATAFPSNTVIIGANAEFAKRAPGVVALLKRWRLTNDIVAEALAYMRTENASADAAAARFVKAHPETWSAWVPADVAERVKAGL
jgi:glycine betaine/proline transport system substrate-binding protein